MISKYTTLVRYEFFSSALSLIFFVFVLFHLSNSEYFSWGIFLFCLSLFIYVIIVSFRTYMIHKSNSDYYHIKPNYKTSVLYIIMAVAFLIISFLNFDLFFLIIGIFYLINFPLLSSRYILLGPNFLYSKISTRKKYSFKNLKEISISEKNKYLRLEFERETILIETFLEELILEEIVEKVKHKIH